MTGKSIQIDYRWGKKLKIIFQIKGPSPISFGRRHGRNYSQGILDDAEATSKTRKNMLYLWLLYSQIKQDELRLLLYHFLGYCVNPPKANPGQTTQIMDISVVAFSALAVLVAGVFRGYSVFGFSMIAATSMTLVLPPVEVIPVVLVLEILASA